MDGVVVVGGCVVVPDMGVGSSVVVGVDVQELQPLLVAP